MSDKIVKDLEESLSNQQGEVASFAQELREVCPSPFFFFICLRA